MGIGIGYPDFKIYQEYINGTAFEVAMQFVTLFGAGSNGAFDLRPQALKGDYDYESFFLEGEDVARRDPNAVGALTDNPITQEEQVGVKLHRTFHRALTRNQWLRIGQAPEQFSRVYGGQMARKIMKEQVNTGIAAVTAAISFHGGLNYDGSGGTLSHAALINGLAKFGDAAGDIVAWIVHSKPWFDLVGSGVTSQLLEVGGVAVNQGTTGTVGRPAIITDSPALEIAGTTKRYGTLGLTRAAIQCVESESLYTADQEVTGLANIVRRLQSEYAYNLKLRGCRYATTAGSNPDATAIATAANWVKVVTDLKSMPGVRVVTT